MSSKQWLVPSMAGAEATLSGDAIESLAESSVAVEEVVAEVAVLALSQHQPLCFDSLYILLDVLELNIFIVRFLYFIFVSFFFGFFFC
jgi:hypothetical protein